MKIIIPSVDYVFECNYEKCCSIVIENQKLFYDLLMDLSSQIQGNEGTSVLSEDDKVVSIAKKAELLTQFAPFDMNQKTLITKITARLQEIANDSEHYMSTSQLVADWEKYFLELSVEMTGNFEFSKISAETLIKAAGLKIDDIYDSLGEQLLDYMELVQEYETNKLFIFVNLRSFMTDEEMKLFLKNIMTRQLKTLFIESSVHPYLEEEKRHIVDADMCVIC